MLEAIRVWSVGMVCALAAVILILTLWERYGERLVDGCTYLFEDAFEIAGKALSGLVAIAIVVAVCTACYSLGASILEFLADT